jgi:sulfonate transport system substrate-binding protein
VRAVVSEIAEANAWVSADIPGAARQLSPAIGIPAPILEAALRRQSYGVSPLGEAVVAEQQRVADAFHTLGLLPRPVRVADAVRSFST